MEFHQVSDGKEWLSLSEIARRTGVSAASVCRKVQQFEKSGLLTSRFAKAGGARTVDIEAFIRLQESTRDAVQAAKSVLATPARERRRVEARKSAIEALDGRETTLQEEQIRRTRADADLKEMSLRQKRSEVMETISVREAMATAAGVLARGLDQLHSVTEEVLEAGTKGGVATARAVLKAYGRTLRERLAAEMRLLARGADGDGEEMVQDAS